MKSLDSVEVQYCDNHIIVAVKPCGMLTQSNGSGSPDLEAFLKLWIKNEAQKQGNVFLHCIHRVDRSASGLVLFARTSKALSRLNEQSRLQEIQRTYLAEVEGILSQKEARLDHYLIHGDHKALLAEKTATNAKHARLFYKVITFKLHTTLIEVELETGRYHQIRAQFSAIGHPIVDDPKYGSQSGDGKAIRLHCQKLCFRHPVTKEMLAFESIAPFAVLSE